tara:strand:- start:299 stop:568 length:270 start_codon:yes stop_codon:yes gene_type:complete
MSILISTDPKIYDCNCCNDDIDMEDYEDDNEVIIVFDEMKNTIEQIEANLTNGIELSSIFIFIDKDNEDKDDIFDLLINIYSKINFIID